MSVNNGDVCKDCDAVRMEPSRALAGGYGFHPYTGALVLGDLSGSRRPFEAVLIALMYFGPINDMWKFDFMGLTSNNATVYLTVAAILFGLGAGTQRGKEKRLIGARRQ